MDISEKYRQYRKAGMVLNGKITEKFFNDDALNDAVNLLGLDRQGKTILFDSEFEMDVMQDFMMFERVGCEKKAVDKYREQYPVDSEMEEEILNALINARTSLFKIESIDRVDNVLWLSDVLTGEQNLRLVDIGFSTNAEEGLLMFTRLISFDDFCMTSGVSFVFHPSVEDYIQRRYRKLIKRVKGGDEALKKFVVFFKLSKDCGMEVINK